MVFSKTRTHDLRNVKQLNCWGSELTDVSILRKMPYVQVLSLSVNSITSLADFGECRNLQELYLRDNKIKDLNQLLYLQELPNLKKLYLAGNPCAEKANYRMTVLRLLPNLEQLDNVAVTSDEVAMAEVHGADLLGDSGNSQGRSVNDSGGSEDGVTEEYDDEDEPVDEDAVHANLRRLNHHQSNQSVHSHHSNAAAGQHAQHQQQVYNAPGDSAGSSKNLSHSTQQSQGNLANCHQHQVGRLSNQQRHNYPSTEVLSSTPNGLPVVPQTRPPPAHLVAPVQSSSNMSRSSSVSDYIQSGLTPNNMDTHCSNSPSQYSNGTGSASKASSFSSGDALRGRLLPKGGRNRNANILSAILCLIKELDMASLEVVDTEIHCRMEELNGP